MNSREKSPPVNYLAPRDQPTAAKKLFETSNYFTKYVIICHFFTFSVSHFIFFKIWTYAYLTYMRNTHYQLCELTLLTCLCKIWNGRKILTINKILTLPPKWGAKWVKKCPLRNRCNNFKLDCSQWIIFSSLKRVTNILQNYHNNFSLTYKIFGKCTFQICLSGVRQKVSSPKKWHFLSALLQEQPHFETNLCY